MLPKYMVCVIALLSLNMVGHQLCGMTKADKTKIRKAIEKSDLDGVIKLVQNVDYNPPDFTDPTCDAMLLYTTIVHDNIGLAKALSEKKSLEVSYDDIKEVVNDQKKQPNRFTIARLFATRARQDEKKKIELLIAAEEKAAGIPPVSGEEIGGTEMTDTLEKEETQHKEEREQKEHERQKQREEELRKEQAKREQEGQEKHVMNKQNPVQQALALLRLRLLALAHRV